MKEDDIFDFGFTAVDETELESAQDLASKDLLIEKLKEKTDRLYKSILPLLNNLKKNPEKDYIFWPDRSGKIEDFEKKLKQIYDDAQ